MKVVISGGSLNQVERGNLILPLVMKNVIVGLGFHIVSPSGVEGRSCQSPPGELWRQTAGVGRGRSPSAEARAGALQVGGNVINSSENLPPECEGAPAEYMTS